MSNYLRPHELQHARVPCLSLSPWVCSDSCPLSQWCHPTIFSSVTPSSSCSQSFPASESFPVNWLFTSGGQNIGASALASNINITIYICVCEYVCISFLLVDIYMFLFYIQPLLSLYFRSISWVFSFFGFPGG